MATSKNGPFPEAEQLANKVAELATGCLTNALVALGNQLGLYRALAQVGPADSARVAQAAGLEERFVREWLHQQAAAGLVATDEEAATFWLSEAAQMVLVKEHGPDASPFFSAPFCTMALEATRNQDMVADAFRTGRGFSYAALSSCSMCSMARLLNVWPRHFLLNKLAAIPGLADKLAAGAKVADVGCGCGSLLRLVAKAYLAASFHGYDIDEASLAAARQAADQEGLRNLTFSNPSKEGGALPDKATYDLVLVNDALHDMTRPDLVLAAIHKAIKPDGVFLIADMSGGDSPAANICDNPLGPLMYGFSVLICLQSGTSEPGGLGLGTLGFHERVARSMTAEAGFTGGLERLDWQSPINAYYLVRP